MAKKISYPKSIYYKKDKKIFTIEIFSKKSKILHYIGTAKNIEDALKKRDEWLVNNYQLVEGYLPRGITMKRNKYQAQIKTADMNYHIGLFDTLQEAIDYRTKFILGLL